MDKIEIKIGLLEDDSNKLVYLKTNLKKGFSSVSNVDKMQKYSKYLLKPIDLDIVKRKEKVVDDIISLIKDGEIDALFIDYKLSTYSNIPLNGVEITKTIQEYFHLFPIYIMTAYDDDLYQNEIFTPSRVFDSSRYINDQSVRDEIHVKIVEEVHFHEKMLNDWQEKLIALMNKKEVTEDEKEIMIDLDSKIEEYLFTKDRLPKNIKTDANLSRLSEIAENVEKILERITRR